jgi:hypothetical protein
LDRGNSSWAAASTTAKNNALTTASDYVDSFRKSFPGKKTDGRAQEREWPRYDSDAGANVVDAAGEEITSTVVPVEVEYATYEGALLIIDGISLTLVPASSSSTAGTVLRKRVKAGPVETDTTYSAESGADSDVPWFQKIMDLLENVMTGGSSGTTVSLLRV